jgi:photosystem II stability/assembly factor-like uncharacterized protein
MMRFRHNRMLRWVLALVLVIVVVREGSATLARQGPRVSALAAADFGQWTFVGPTHLLSPITPYSGRVTSIAVDPADPNHWLVGAAQGGVWDTRDAGATWQPRTDGQPSLAIGAIAFSPTSPGVVYAGTGEANFCSFCYAGAGMLRSNDSGSSWTVVNTSTFARASVKAILVDPSDPDVVVAGTARGYAGRDLGPVVSPPLYGIQRSTDGGRTWTRALTGQVSSLVRHPTDFSRQYAAIGDPTGTPTRNDDVETNPARQLQPGTMPNGVYRTTDAGDHWAPVPGPWTSTDATAFGAGFVTFAVAASNPEVMYASVQLPGGNFVAGFLGLFRTNNAWAATPEWTKIPSDPVVRTGQGAYCGDKCAYAHVISVDPADPDTLFVGTIDVWRCRNCASSPTWLKVSGSGTSPQQDVHVDQHGFAWVGNRLITVNDGGVYSSIDKGAVWRPHNTNLPLVQFYGGAVHPTRSNLILGNTFDNLLNRFTGAAAWERMASSLSVAEGGVIMSSTRPDSDWGVTMTSRYVGRTTDGGRSFQEVQAGIDPRAPYPGGPFMTTLRKCPADDDVVFVGAISLWRTDRFFSAPAPTWSINGGVDLASCGGTGRLVTLCGRITAVAFPGADSCNAYAFGTGGGFLRITANGGASWSDFDPRDSVPARAVTAIAFAPADPNVAYLTLGSFDEWQPGRPGHVFKSTNALSPSPTWTNVTPPDTNIPFNTILVDPARPSTIYAGADNGMWASADAGTTWTYMGPDAGVPNVAVFDLQRQEASGKIFAFTFGRGVFVLTPPGSPAAVRGRAQ